MKKEESVISQIAMGLERGRKLYESIAAEIEEPGRDDPPGDAVKAPCGACSVNHSELACGDNIEYMKKLLRAGYRGSFRLIYIDPPFFTRSKFNAAVSLRDAEGRTARVRHLVFDDTFERSLEYYIESLSVRLMLIRDLLSDTGSLWIHLDWHSSYYVKIILDEIMGSRNYVNEIIWCYKSGGSGKRHFSRKHDSILVYGKTDKYYIRIPEEKSYNRGFKPYNFKGVREYSDENGWYTLVNMKDVWNIDMVGRSSAERTGYATQKPLALMNRIIEAASERGDLTGDFFCGSGSFAEAAAASGRRFMCCDNERLAASISRRRLRKAGYDFTFSHVKGADGDGNAEPEGNAGIRVRSIEPLGDGRIYVKCGLQDFGPYIETGYVHMSDRAVIEELLQGDTVRLADYILIDGSYDGDFKDEFFFYDVSDIGFISTGRAAAVVVDIFGREYFTEIDLG